MLDKDCWISAYSSIPTLKEVHKFDKFKAIEHTRIEKYRKRLEAIEYKVFVCGSRLPRNGRVISIVIVVYDTRIDYVKEAVESALGQDYASVELIIVDHGTTGAVKKYLRDTAKNIPNGLILDVKDHIYPLGSTNPSERIALLWNAALLASSGDYIYLLSCDDKLSSCYAKRMVNVFERYSCTCAAPGITIMDSSSKIDQVETHRLAQRNQRAEVEDSARLCKDYIANGRKISFPGGYLCQRTDRVKMLGGFDTDNDRTQLLNFATPGSIGSDFESTIFWRYHGDQANEKQVRYGCIYYKNTIDNYLELKLYERHALEVGTSFAKAIETFIYLEAEKEIMSQIQNSVRYGLRCQMTMLARVYEQCSKSLFFRSLCFLFRVNVIYVAKRRVWHVIRRLDLTRWTLRRN